MTEQSNNALLHYLERIAVALEEINEKLDELVSYEEEFNMEDFDFDLGEEDWDEDEDDDDDDDEDEEEGGDDLPPEGGERFNDSGRSIYDVSDPSNLGSDRF